MDHLSFIRKIASALNLSKTDVEILKTLVKGKKLLVSDITNYIKRSERHIRQRLAFLTEKGLLKRNIEVLSNKRLAYRYSLRPFENIVDEVRKDLFRKIEDLEKSIAEKDG